jgi:hypothetical protein
MEKKILFGPTFGDEIIAAGLGGLPFTWGSDSTIEGRENLTDEQKVKLAEVIKQHDPEVEKSYFNLTGRLRWNGKVLEQEWEVKKQRRAIPTIEWYPVEKVSKD